MKFLKVLALVIASLLVILIVLFYIQGDVFIASRVKEAVKNATSGAYNADIGDVRLNLIPFGIRMNNLRIHPAEGAIPQPVAFGDTAFVVNVKISDAAVLGISVMDLLSNDTIKINTVELQGIDLNLKAALAHNGITLKTASKSADKKILVLEKVKLGTFEMLIQQEQNDNTFTLFKTVFSGEIGDLILDKPLENSLPSFEFAFSELTTFSKDRLYQISADKLLISSERSWISASNLQVKPQLEKTAFSRAKGKQTDRIDLSCANLEIKDINFDQLLAGDGIAVDKIVLADLDAEFYRDRREPRKGHKTKPLPHQTLDSLDIPVKINALEVKNSRLIYQEVHPDGDKAGEVVFDKFNVLLTGLDTKSGSAVLVDAQTDLYGQGHLQASIRIPMSDDSLYQVNASLSSMPATAFNPMLREVAFLEFETGQIKMLDIHFTHNLEIATGVLKMKYENLKLSGYDATANHSVKLTDRAKIFAANKFILNNPNTTVTGDISYERDEERAIFNLWWKAVLSGLKDIEP